MLNCLRVFALEAFSLTAKNLYLFKEASSSLTDQVFVGLVREEGLGGSSSSAGTAQGRRGQMLSMSFPFPLLSCLCVFQSVGK